jgi:hypothetical protein
MDELIFVGMDIVEETKGIINAATPICTNGMTESELEAYNLGVKNALSALQGVIDVDTENEFALNINGLDIPTEFTADYLACYLSDLF